MSDQKNLMFGLIKLTQSKMQRGSSWKLLRLSLKSVFNHGKTAETSVYQDI